LAVVHGAFADLDFFTRPPVDRDFLARDRHVDRPVFLHDLRADTDLAGVDRMRAHVELFFGELDGRSRLLTTHVAVVLIAVLPKQVLCLT
jgi:hypothetical protein